MCLDYYNYIKNTAANNLIAINHSRSYYTDRQNWGDEKWTKVSADKCLHISVIELILLLL